MKLLATVLISAVTAFAGLLGVQQVAPNLGAFNFVASGTYKLAGGGISSTDTSIAVDNFLKPISNNQYVMATDFGDIGYATLEPGSATKKEFVSFTGITYSGNRATLTGVTRGLEFNYPYTASTTLRQSHAGGTTLIISNPPQLYAQLAVKQNTETITGAWTFTTNPFITTTPTTDTHATNKTYVDTQVNSVIAGGVVPATPSTAGILRIASSDDMASTTILSGSYYLGLTASSSTSTPGTLCGYCIPISLTGGKLSDLWTDFSIHKIFTSAFFTHASTTNATSTNHAITGLWGIGGTYFSFLNSTPTASSSVPMMDANRQISWNLPNPYTIYATGATLTTSSSASTTLATVKIPGGTLQADDVIEVKANYDSANNLNNCNIQWGNGSASTTVAGSYTFTSEGGVTEVYINNNGSVSSQTYAETSITYFGDDITASRGTASVNTASDAYIAFICRNTGGGAVNIKGATVQIHR